MTASPVPSPAPLARSPALELPDAEAWALHYVQSTELAVKMEPPPVPNTSRVAPEPLVIDEPGRPPELRPATRRDRTPKPEALRDPRCRARLLHAFWHHELQAAELMCWARLKFADAEPEFKKGLIGICQDEIRHMRLYQAHIEALGYRIGDFGVRDWFWRRVPSCRSKVAFVALMGMGFEARNLEHAKSYAELFRQVGDERAATIQDQVGKEEIAHVSFATRWFKRWTGGCDFETWRAELAPPLSPWVLRAEPIAVEARQRAGMTEEFVRALAAYEPEPAAARGREAHDADAR